MVFLTLSVLIFRKSGRWKNVCCFAGTYKFVGFIVLSKFVKIFGVYLVKIMICFLVHCRISLIILICFSQCLVHINIILCRALWCQGRIMSLKWKISFILHSLWLFCSYFYIPHARYKFCILIKKCICCLLIVNYSSFDCQTWHFVLDDN